MSSGPLSGLVAYLERAAARVDEAPAVAARITAPLLAENVRDEFGSGDLAPLQPSTVASKAAKGYPQPYAPLIATGDLRDSVEPLAVGPIASARSENELARFHEHGFVNARTGTSVPPRPAFRLGLAKTLSAAGLIALNTVRVAIEKE